MKFLKYLSIIVTSMVSMLFALPFMVLGFISAFIGRALLAGFEACEKFIRWMREYTDDN